MLGYNQTNAGIQFVCDQSRHAPITKGVSGIRNIIYNYNVKALTSLALSRLWRYRLSACLQCEWQEL